MAGGGGVGLAAEAVRVGARTRGRSARFAVWPQRLRPTQKRAGPIFVAAECPNRGAGSGASCRGSALRRAAGGGLPSGSPAAPACRRTQRKHSLPVHHSTVPARSESELDSVRTPAGAPPPTSWKPAQCRAVISDRTKTTDADRRRLGRSPSSDSRHEWPTFVLGLGLLYRTLRTKKDCPECL